MKNIYKCVNYCYCMLMVGVVVITSCGYDIPVSQDKNNGGTDYTLGSILASGKVPSELVLAKTSAVTQQIFEPYKNYPGASFKVIYITPDGAGLEDGTSWEDAREGDDSSGIYTGLQGIVNRIADASKDKIYILLLSEGTYTIYAGIHMKNYVAIVGGWDGKTLNRDPQKETILRQAKELQTVVHAERVHNVSLLYGVSISNNVYISALPLRAALFNQGSSPTITQVVFSNNKSDSNGALSSTGVAAGMVNHGGEPKLTQVTFYNNQISYNNNIQTIGKHFVVGAMANHGASPLLKQVAFINNTGNSSVYAASAMVNLGGSPMLSQVTFANNESNGRLGSGAVLNLGATITMTQTVFANNKNKNTGSALSLYRGSDAVITNSILWGNDNSSIYIGNEKRDTGDYVLNIYSSVLQGGKDGIVYESTDVSNVNYVEQNVITEDPQLGELGVYGNSFVEIFPVGKNSPGIDKGLYVKMRPRGPGFARSVYYSFDNENWHRNASLTEIALGSTTVEGEALPYNTIDLTATDARGSKIVGRPDIGMYEQSNK